MWNLQSNLTDYNDKFKLAGEWWEQRVLQLVSTHNFGEKKRLFQKNLLFQSESVKVRLLVASQIGANLVFHVSSVTMYLSRQTTLKETRVNTKLLSKIKWIKSSQYMVAYYVINTVFFLFVQYGSSNKSVKNGYKWVWIWTDDDDQNLDVSISFDEAGS